MGKKKNKSKTPTWNGAGAEPGPAAVAEADEEEEAAPTYAGPRLPLNCGATVAVRGVKSDRFNGRHGLIEALMSPKDPGRCQVSLLVAGGHSVDPDQDILGVKAANLEVVCGDCFAPGPQSRCSKCKGPSYCNRECREFAPCKPPTLRHRFPLPLPWPKRLPHRRIERDALGGIC